MPNICGLFERGRRGYETTSSARKSWHNTATVAGVELQSMGLSDYFAGLERKYAAGDATEHSYRSALEQLLESTGDAISATNEPSQIAGNAPDFVVRRAQTIVGHVEAKDIDQPLDQILNSEQLVRYREALPNLILTDYLQFIWLSDGEELIRIRLGRTSGKEIVPEPNAEDDWQKLTTAFLSKISPTIKSPKQLAEVMGAQTRLLRDLILDVLEKEDGDGELSAQKKAFSETLVPGQTNVEFSDMFAQTISYGLFTAKIFDETPEDFSLEEAYSLIPKANPFLRRLFHYVGSPDLTEGVRWMIEQIVDILRHADMDEILEKFGARAGFEDPIFHFYETFLAEYDPAEREQRGVYFTPEPVVDFIVRATETVLVETFGEESGFASDDVVILDPAVGTATFLRKIIDEIHTAKREAGIGGAWPSFVRDKLLPRMFGFELLMAPYTVAHLKLELQLYEQGFEFHENERLHVYLTNSLDRIEGTSGSLMDQWLSKESEGAEDVKENQPVQVVIGNPPYRGESTNKSDWIMQLMELYKKEPTGERLQERTGKWINNDYVKFIRLAHWKIAKTGKGVVAFITSHSWIDNPTFRGMRAALLRDFDDIYILNLHGNTQKETMPDEFKENGEDKNVFDIVQGVAVVVLVKSSQSEDDPANVHYADLWGSRDFKYEYLSTKDLSDIQWVDLDPVLPHLLFVPIDPTHWEEYRKGWAVPDIFPHHGTGIVTKCDKLAIHFDAESAWETVKWFASASESEVRSKIKLPKPTVRDWKFDWARQDVMDSGPAKDKVIPILYRPFDTRYLYYTGKSRGFIGWPVTRIMNHFAHEKNVALITSRLTKGEVFAHVQVTDKPSEVICMSSKTSNNGFVFPLWLIEDSDEPHDDMFDTPVRPNISPEYSKALADSLELELDAEFDLPKTVTPEDIFAYVFAMLHAPTYRRRYEEYLRGDFPKIPLPTDIMFFRRMVELGQDVIDVSLMRKVPANNVATFDSTGSNKIERIEYECANGDSGRVIINDEQFFDRVPNLAWDFNVGGYQVLEKWLKSRRNRVLTFDDVEHFQMITRVIIETQKVMTLIDNEVRSDLIPD